MEIAANRVTRRGKLDDEAMKQLQQVLLENLL